MQRNLSILAVLIGLTSTGFSQGPPASASPLAVLSAFLGEWDCAGKFERSGQSIEARLSLKYDLNEDWIVFRHDDKPPFPYHALSEWGWDEALKEFVMLAEDSSGGIRVFRAPASEQEIVWTGDVLGSANPPAQRFTFRTLDARHFSTSYLVLRGTKWILVDSSTCTKT